MIKCETQILNVFLYGTFELVYLDIIVKYIYKISRNATNILNLLLQSLKGISCFFFFFFFFLCRQYICRDRT